MKFSFFLVLVSIFLTKTVLACPDFSGKYIDDQGHLNILEKLSCEQLLWTTVADPHSPSTILIPTDNQERSFAIASSELIHFVKHYYGENKMKTIHRLKNSRSQKVERRVESVLSFDEAHQVLTDETADIMRRGKMGQNKVPWFTHHYRRIAD